MAQTSPWATLAATVPSSAAISTPPSVPSAVDGVFRAEALALRTVDLSKHKPSIPLLNRMPANFWLRNCAIPWVQLGDTVAIAFGSAEVAESQRQVLTDRFGPFIPVLATEPQILPLLQQHFKTAMARQANISIAPELSTRTLFSRSKRLKQLLPVSSFVSLSIVFPLEVFAVCCGAALILLMLYTVLKLAGLAAHLMTRAKAHQAPLASGAQPQQSVTSPPPPAEALPKISVLVPLYKEAAISSALLKRLGRLQYPAERMDVILVLEEGDTVTQQAISKASLPSWMQAIEVPIWGSLRTKPRAMNYALNFCRGDIVGVWDAEDAPQPDQLHRVAAAFAQAPPDVACFQGVLDYYNPRANWMSRCFTLEYAGWFRIVLQGIAQLKLVVPLGGTTMFIRRAVLDDLGGWDAHNVTEDADLGVRLFRAGHRTQMLPTATYEEATCHLPAWIRQRSRWLKGFMATYLVNMRQPVRLARELGWAGFLGFQAFFLGTVGQFLLSPFLWTYWLIAFGVPHPSAEILPEHLLYLGVSWLVFFELCGMIIAAFGAFASGRPGLALWVPVLPFYYLMGPIAVYKALYELLYDPYFWDKTSHGVHPPDTNAQHHLGPSDNPAFTEPEPPPRPKQTAQPDYVAAYLGEAQSAQSQSAQAKEARSQTEKTASTKNRADNAEQV
ncbi:glycosyltransferase [Pseudophaeobacter flagellatus]|uniref:glycosyltransferase n=1 Tax=Pseudophaeobacter flagellatus TaxID=2899119 RepID=UPI001E511552|nr:glycosyltransferase [Pseudophaeobacter flagellatus]MCD9148473.1 glycosyltransferase [Pseudophaeobacter flagellatus]